MSFRSGLLWKVKSSNKPASYLFGTIHLQTPIFSDHQLLITEKINSCNFFGAEVDLDQMESSDLQQYFKLPQYGNWSTSLRPAQWIKMQKLSQERFGIDLNHFTSMYPMIGLNQLSLQLIGRAQEKSLDQQLWELAKESNRQMVGLEDFDAHFNMIRSIELKDQIKMIRELFKNLEQSKRKYKKMITDYNNQDLQAIYQSSRKMLGKYRQVMLNQRNQFMLVKMIELMKIDTGFFSCGAGHLYGLEGLLRLLKKAGFVLQPVKR